MDASSSCHLICAGYQSWLVSNALTVGRPAPSISSSRAVIQSGIFTLRAKRNAKLPAPPAPGLCHACFQHNEFLQAESSPQRHSAQLRRPGSSDISKWARLAQVNTREVESVLESYKGFRSIRHTAGEGRPPVPVINAAVCTGFYVKKEKKSLPEHWLNSQSVFNIGP
ncbi:hypothetical protein WMY93_015491 [Mugilogobius chulae]|uniref:Uncharacterized protein n=1 Tax=Mugilogobius chulae TaxID=88201 RepID=A0AAW0NUW9_9GOBI